MRRIVAVTLSAVALVATAMPSAGADTTTIARSLAVDLATFIAGGVPIDSAGCSADLFPASPPPTFGIANSPLDTLAPSTQRIWTQTFSNSSMTGGSYGPTIFPNSSADLAVFSTDVYNGTSGQAVIYYYNADGSGFIGRAPIAGTANAWAQVSGANLTYTWTPFDVDFNPSGATSTATISAFAVAHGQAAGGWNAALEFGCDAHNFAFQNVVFGDTPGNLQVTDYEDLTNDVVSKPSASFVASGGAVTIGGSSQYGGPSTATLSFHDPTMSAYATAKSNVAATSVDDLTCDMKTFICRNPFAGVGLHPKYNVVYRWCYGSTVAVQASCGSFATIHVQAVIAATYPSSVSNGRSFAVTGKVTPLRPGTQVTLWGKKGTTTVKLGTATLSSTGAYKVNATIRSTGSWTVWLTTPNDKYNAAGKSAAKSYSVR
ncbi:hypothetical protein Back2_22540 [Nocardioides baekrokdamisoli]|uniref:Bacterial Ig-like domain-containing protein n=1 Tax=Nocardioides baekrokdamisoli TaxID=1804624 RepID=A0A3G9IG56_9ACTN|nr:hypothetical protein [Nocardioides baekrokdamisoli]BBH17967.1 hypothetical protein Back2_22540 [Nocardioides baekrokdamisoli]